MSKYAFGVDIGGTTVKMGLFDKEGNVLDKWEIPTVKTNGGEQILPDVAASIKAKMEEKSIALADVAGIGMGAPGAVDDEGTMVGGAVNLGWGVFNIPETMKKYLDLPVKAANDANVAALGEMWQGGGKGYKNMVAVTLGTGVGGGIIINGEILTGSTGAGGEIGHIHIEDNETEVCGCKNKGCLEQYASATGIVKEMKRTLAAEDGACPLRGQDFSCKDVLDAAKAGDPLAEKTVHRCMDYLALAMSCVSMIADPEVFVIGGGVSKAGNYLVDMLQKRYNELTPLSSKKSGIFIANLSNDAGMYGAARLVL